MFLDADICKMNRDYFYKIQLLIINNPNTLNVKSLLILVLHTPDVYRFRCFNIIFLLIINLYKL